MFDTTRATLRARSDDYCSLSDLVRGGGFSSRRVLSGGVRSVRGVHLQTLRSPDARLISLRTSGELDAIPTLLAHGLRANGVQDCRLAGSPALPEFPSPRSRNGTV